ncbi:hypothetical protein Q0F98_03920 [Paenibacillus amylolyticus]|nr:hypothetical protein Q0F98_03920 [Paenibacillus amylolyticus]
MQVLIFKWNVTRNGLTVEYYYFNDDPSKKKIVDRYINQAFKVIDFYSDKYGKYPYPEFRIVETYVQGVAVEYAGLFRWDRFKMVLFQKKTQHLFMK